MRLVDDGLEILVDFGEYRFRWHEHEGGVLRLALDQVFFRDIADMDIDVAAEGLCRDLLQVGAIGGADGIPGFQREFGIDGKRGRAVRHFHQAIGPAAIRQGRLEFIGAMRQSVGNDRLHARLAESTARLLVGEDRLQLHDLAGERLDVALRRIDDRQPLLQFGQAFMCRSGLLAHRLADTAGHGVEPLADRLRQLRLPRAEHFGDGAHAALHLGLALQNAGHARLGIAGKAGGFLGGDGPRPG